VCFCFFHFSEDSFSPLFSLCLQQAVVYNQDYSGSRRALNVSLFKYSSPPFSTVRAPPPPPIFPRVSERWPLAPPFDFLISSPPAPFPPLHNPAIQHNYGRDLSVSAATLISVGFLALQNLLLFLILLSPLAASFVVHRPFRGRRRSRWW